MCFNHDGYGMKPVVEGWLNQNPERGQYKNRRNILRLYEKYGTSKKYTDSQ